ncbi:hypothetical protein LVJ94_25800 [Pendulispora rubella]|uniref:Uncharacterized protein n=1 Tax=Pendulispora rubella TaxID=2741070 RepID=A0ABZ2LI53_9BACT
MRRLTGLMVFAVSILCAGMARADDNIDVTFDDIGGVTYVVHSPALNLKGNFLRREGSKVVVPYSSTWRTGCSVVTPQLSVSHAPGPGLFVPEMSIWWLGEFAPDSLVVGLNLTVLRPGQNPIVIERPVNAGELNLVKYSESDGEVIYRGDKDNRVSATAPIGLSYDVKQGDKVQLSICLIGPGTSLTIDDFNFHSYPRGT